MCETKFAKPRFFMEMQPQMVFFYIYMLCFCGARGQTVDMLMLRMDWNPSNCIASTCAQPPVDAFTLSDLIPWNSVTLQLHQCHSPYTFSPGDISGTTKQIFDCIYLDASVPPGGSNVGLWSSTWSDSGTCTGMSPSDYFNTMANSYVKYNPNIVVSKLYNGVVPDSVDRDTFLSQIESVLGYQAWLECDSHKNVDNIVVCLQPSYPFDIMNCPFRTNDPTSKNAVGCAGSVYFVKSTNPSPITPSSTCQSFMGLSSSPSSSSTPSSLPSGSPDSQNNSQLSSTSGNPTGNDSNNANSTNSGSSPSSSSSSSSTALIAGIAGGVVIAVIIAAIIGFILVKRSKRRKKNEPMGAAESGNAYIYEGPGGRPGLISQRYASSPPGNSIMPPAMHPLVVDAYTADSKEPSDSKSPSHVDGISTAPSFPETPTSLNSASRARGSFSADPLLEYITSALSLRSSNSSRGSLASWEIRFADISIIKPLGEGSFGRVYLGKWNETEVAVKILLDGVSGSEPTHSALAASNNPIMSRLDQEASLMSTLHHPHVVQFCGIITIPPAIVCEYCSRGSLTSVLQLAATNPTAAQNLTWSRRIGMAADACRGMIYLHSRTPPIIHRDLKSANLLVTGGWRVKVSDFNLSKILEDSTKTTSLQAMNPRWLAPEVLNGETATLAADVFAFGVILWELMTWKLPWGTYNPWIIVNQVTSGNRLKTPSDPSELPGPDIGLWPHLTQYIQLIQKCWAQNPRDRPAFNAIMNDLRSIDPVATQNDGV